MNFKCKRCGKCCLILPCVFAQIKHNVDPKSKLQCPDLVRDGKRYKCRRIECDQEARNTLLDGRCSHPNKKQKTVNLGEIVKEFFPDATKKQIEFILWEKTGYPEFWKIGIDGWTPSQCLRKELSRLKTERINQ